MCFIRECRKKRKEEWKGGRKEDWLKTWGMSLGKEGGQTSKAHRELGGHYRSHFRAVPLVARMYDYLEIHSLMTQPS